MWEIIVGLILGVVEGLTEFIPVSSTGHLILVGTLLGFTGERAATFDVVIQLGAILAVVVLFRARLLALVTGRTSGQFDGAQGRLALALTTFPALVVGALAHDLITQRLFNPVTVALGLGVGGVAMLIIERRPQPTGEANLNCLTPRRALVIGLVQCLALWPGASRSAATILGGMSLGLNRATAVEYSFLAAIPIIGAAAVFELAQSWRQLSLADLPLFTAGFAMAFVSAWLAVRYFLRWLQYSTLRPFGYYRVALALVLLILIQVGR